MSKKLSRRNLSRTTLKCHKKFTSSNVVKSFCGVQNLRQKLLCILLSQYKNVAKTKNCRHTNFKKLAYLFVIPLFAYDYISNVLCSSTCKQRTTFNV